MSCNVWNRNVIFIFVTSTRWQDIIKYVLVWKVQQSLCLQSWQVYKVFDYISHCYMPTEEKTSSRLPEAQHEGCLSADVLIGCCVSAHRGWCLHSLLDSAGFLKTPSFCWSRDGSRQAATNKFKTCWKKSFIYKILNCCIQCLNKTIYCKKNEAYCLTYFPGGLPLVWMCEWENIKI